MSWDPVFVGFACGLTFKIATLEVECRVEASGMIEAAFTGSIHLELVAELHTEASNEDVTEGFPWSSSNGSGDGDDDRDAAADDDEDA